MARLVDVAFEFSITKTVGGECINRAKNIIVFVIKKWSLHAFWKLIAYIACFLAYLIPDVWYSFGWGRFLQMNGDQCFARF